MIPCSDSWYQVFPSYLTGMEGGGGGWGCGNRRKLHHFTPLLRIVSWMVLGFDANTSETNLSIYIDRQQFSHCCLSCQRGVSKDVGSLFIWLKIMSRCVSSFCRIWWMNEKKKKCENKPGGYKDSLYLTESCLGSMLNVSYATLIQELRFLSGWFLSVDWCFKWRLCGSGRRNERKGERSGGRMFYFVWKAEEKWWNRPDTL